MSKLFQTSRQSLNGGMDPRGNISGRNANRLSATGPNPTGSGTIRSQPTRSRNPARYNAPPAGQKFRNPHARDAPSTFGRGRTGQATITRGFSAEQSGQCSPAWHQAQGEIRYLSSALNEQRGVYSEDSYLAVMKTLREIKEKVMRLEREGAEEGVVLQWKEFLEREEDQERWRVDF